MSIIFQSTYPSQNFYVYNKNIAIFHNNQLDNNHISFLKNYDPCYIPNTSFDLNKTIISEYQHTKLLIQMSVLLNRCEIILPHSLADYFRDHMFESIICYLLETIKLFCTVDIANDLRFGINLYVTSNCYESSIDWWNSPYNLIKKDNISQSIFGSKFTYEHSKLTLNFKFDKDFKLLTKSQLNHSNNLFSNNNLFGSSNQSSNNNLFGSSNQSSNNNLFGLSNQSSNNNLFGLSNQSSNNNLLGSSNQSSNNNLFGSSNQSSNNNLFGSSNQSSNNNLFSLSNSNNLFSSSNSGFNFKFT
jgi:hypothetical protein